MKFKITLTAALFVLTVGIHTVYNVFEAVFRGQINANTVKASNFNYALQQLVLNHNLTVWLWVGFGLVMAFIWWKRK